MDIVERKGMLDDEREIYEMSTDGVLRLCVFDISDCPEDARLSRDLGFAYTIVKLMREAHAAGVAGEPFNVSQSEYKA